MHFQYGLKDQAAVVPQVSKNHEWDWKGHHGAQFTEHMVIVNHFTITTLAKKAFSCMCTGVETGHGDWITFPKAHR